MVAPSAEPTCGMCGRKPDFAVSNGKQILPLCIVCAKQIAAELGDEAPSLKAIIADFESAKEPIVKARPRSPKYS